MKSLLVILLLFGVLEASPELKPEIVSLLKPKLNSERVTYFFGNYGIEVIHLPNSPFGENRISNQYSIESDEKIMRTLAVVDFQQPMHPALREAHQQILGGQSIGTTLVKKGWKIDKYPLYFGNVPLSSGLQKKMHVKSGQAAIHIYKLHVSNNEVPASLHYCTVIEVYSPAFLDEKWLEALYPDEYRSCHAQSGPVSLLLCQLQELVTGFDSSPSQNSRVNFSR